MRPINFDTGEPGAIDGHINERWLVSGPRLVFIAADGETVLSIASPCDERGQLVDERMRTYIYINKQVNPIAHWVREGEVDTLPNIDSASGFIYESGSGYILWQDCVNHTSRIVEGCLYQRNNHMRMAEAPPNQRIEDGRIIWSS